MSCLGRAYVSHETRRFLRNFFFFFKKEWILKIYQTQMLVLTKKGRTSTTETMQFKYTHDSQLNRHFHVRSMISDYKKI